jgi:hypothetical protein
LTDTDWQVYCRGYSYGAQAAYRLVMDREQERDPLDLYGPHPHLGKALLRFLWKQHGNRIADVLWQRFRPQA